MLANRNLKSQALYETRDGSLWYGAKGGLNLLSDGKFIALFILTLPATRPLTESVRAQSACPTAGREEQLY